MNLSVKPIYETLDDLEREREVADFVESVWNAKLIKMPRGYRIDFGAMVNGRLRGWVEVKCRDMSSATYPTVILSLAKWMEGRRLARETNARFFLIISLSDGIFCSDESTAKREINFGGRKDRQDDRDFEPLVHIPISEFRKLGLE